MKRNFAIMTDTIAILITATIFVCGIYTLYDYVSWLFAFLYVQRIYDFLYVSWMFVIISLSYFSWIGIQIKNLIDWRIVQQFELMQKQLARAYKISNENIPSELSRAIKSNPKIAFMILGNNPMNLYHQGRIRRNRIVHRY